LKFPICYGIIPARYASRRFEGKPLAQILGKPMFWHVYSRARRCPELAATVLATDDERIFKAAMDLDVPVVMTRNNHISGTDRVLEAALGIGIPESAVVINIQGDEPALEPSMLSQLIAPFISPEVMVSTLARKINVEEAVNHDRVKVVLAQDGKALYFSRSPIPYYREKNKRAEYFGHIGLYAFRMDILKKFVELGPGHLEKIEKLEQLRFLENGITIHVVVTEYESIGVDRPEDLAIVSRILSMKRN
jgi:3-deoxy-manno-octulosonate cytidylyltransferase (CMP-KDO synthetase)